MAFFLSPRLARVLLGCLMAGIGLHVFLHFAPGAMSPDSISILQQARSGEFSDAHPPLMAVIWRWLDRLVPGPAVMLTLQLVLYYTGIFLILSAFARRHGMLVLPIGLVIGLYPSLIGILGAIWIDILMAGWLLLAAGLILHFRSGSGALRSHVVLLFLLAITLGVAARHNAAAAAFPLVVIAVGETLRSDGKRTRSVFLVLFISATAIASILGLTRVASAAIVEKPGHLWRVAALYDIAGVSSLEKRNLFRPGLIKVSSLDDIQRLYSPRSYIPLVTGEQTHVLGGSAPIRANPLTLNTDFPDFDRELGDNWREVVSTYPRTYLEHRLNFFRAMVHREPWGLFTPIFDMIYPNSLGIEVRQTTDSYPFALSRAWSAKSRIFEPVTYLALSAALVLPVFLAGMRLKDRALLLVAALYASGLAHMAGLFFFAVTPDFRYSHWLIATTMLASGLLLVEVLLALWTAVAQCSYPVVSQPGQGKWFAQVVSTLFERQKSRRRH